MFVKLAKLCTPEYIKNKNLDALFRLTADAFQSEIPELRGLTFSERLARYARFTKEQAEALLYCEGSDEERANRIGTIEGKMYDGSFLLGKDIRKRLRINTWEQAVEALAMIYRIIGVDFHYEGQNAFSPDGQSVFTIKACYFSEYYSAEVCELISSLDEGLAAGLSEGGRLRFTQRMTEDCSCCKGYFGKEPMDS